MKKSWLRILALSSFMAFLAAAAFLFIQKIDADSIVMTNASSVRTIVLDPGHGGEDGGTIGYSGTIEKDLNLDIALRLKDLLEWNGFRVIMIRDGDYALNDDGLSTIGERKRSDMYHRLEMYNSDLQALVISIHLNQYPDSSCRGAQIFYSQNNPASEELAQSIQSAIKLQLQPENHRKIKPAEKNLFLLFHAKPPTVLVECGFISNPEEEALLLQEEYRTKFAMSIFDGMMDYLIG